MAKSLIIVSGENEKVYAELLLSLVTLIDDDKETERTVINPDGSITIDKSANSSTIRGYQIWDASQKFGYAFTDQFSAEIKGKEKKNEKNKKRLWKKGA